MSLVGVESRALSHDGVTFGAESVVGKFESNDGSGEVLVVAFGAGVLADGFGFVGAGGVVGGGDVVAVGLGGGEGTQGGRSSDGG